jgi:hypothetical protein
LTTNQEKLPLTLNLIPRTMWGKNVRAAVSATTWANLRWGLGASLYLRERHEIDFPAEICNAKRRGLDLHEEWVFDDNKKVQRLDRFLAICSSCHLAKHLGHANLMGKLDEALDHLAAVNSISRQAAVTQATEALEKWSERSQHAYELDLSFLETIIPKARIHLDWIGTERSWFGSRFDAISWAREVLTSDALIVDTETTGLPNKSPDVEIIELAILSMNGDVQFNSLFKPSKPISNAEIHNINDGMVVKSNQITDSWNKIIETINGKVVIAYNAKFDREVFQTTAELYGLSPPNCKWHCIMQAWWTFNNLPYTRLPNSEHRALGDARAALTLIKEMASSDIHAERW